MSFARHLMLHRRCWSSAIIPAWNSWRMHLPAQPKAIAARKLAKEMALKFPTCALAVLDFRIADWRAVNPGIGRLADFVRPKDLPPAMDGEEN